jgi:hypothetical protein
MEDASAVDANPAIAFVVAPDRRHFPVGTARRLNP